MRGRVNGSLVVAKDDMVHDISCCALLHCVKG